jgi:D-alanyl-D-alanine carboxypeptidase
MKNYIKLISIALLAVMLLSACGKGDETSSSEAPISEETSIVEESSEDAAPSSEEASIPSSSKAAASTAAASKAATNTTEVEGDWKLVLVNRDNPIPEGYVPTLSSVRGYQVDSRIADALSAMLDDCRAAGLDPKICSAYRSISTQTTLYNNEVQKWVNNGYSNDDAKVKAATIVAAPTTSEHHLGLAIDIVARSHQILNQTQENTAEYKWLAANCQNYGFIVRYPNGKTDKTFVIYEPWHFRYVGIEAAKDVMASGVAFEEYLAN